MCRSEISSFPTPLPCPAPVLPADTMPLRQLSKPMKPRLSRKIATSARINLNKYWHVLEELMPLGRKAFDESDCNAINENMDNERRLAAMQLSESEGFCTTMADHCSNNSSHGISMEASTSLTSSESSSIPVVNSTPSTTASENSAFPIFSISDPTTVDEGTPAKSHHSTL